MKVYALAHNFSVRNTNPVKSHRRTWAYREMFHGSSTATVNRYGERPYQPRGLRHNIRILPPVFFPGISMVVNEENARDLKWVAGVDLNACSWESLYDLPVDEDAMWAMVSEFSAFDDSFSFWLARVSRPPRRGEQLPQFREVIAHPHAPLQKHFATNRTLHFPFTIEETEPVETCVELHQKYPITRHPPFYLIAESVFSRLARDVADEDLFTLVEYSV